MSKELEALERLIENYYKMCQDTGYDSEYQRTNLPIDYEIIETALDQKAKQDEVLELLFKWFEPQIISEIGKLPRLQIKCGTFTFSYEFENEYDWRLVKDLIAQRKKTK